MSNPPAPTSTRRRGADELLTRTAAGLVLAVVALGAAFLGGWPIAVLAALVSVAVAVEWRRIVGRGDPAMALYGTVLAAVALAGLGWPGLAGGFVCASAVALWAVGGGWFALGAPYAASFGIGVLALRADPEFGWPALAFLFASVWMTDTAAYVCGRAIGGPRLWPRVSPNKTWSGAIGGLVLGAGAGFGVAVVLGIPPSPGLALLASALSLLGQGGDLLESAVKRHFGVKDAGHIIPGHGGVMDRVDALSIAAIVAALIGWLHGGPEAVGRGVLIW